jgi:uncharacterized damage-inducible protein DinB
LLRELRAARGEWEGLLAAIPEERMTEAGATGGWSVKDVVAHVTWGEQEMIPVIRERMLKGSDLWQMDDDTRNALVVEQSADRPLEDVLHADRQAYQELIAAIEGLEDADLTDPSRIRSMPPRWALWQLIKGNTFGHYPEHVEWLREWLEHT